MSNALLSPKVYANAFVHLLTNELVIAKKVSGEFKDEFKKIGSTVYAKRVPEFTIRDGAVASIQDVVEGEVAVTIDKQKGVDVEFTSVEDTLTVDSLLKSRVMKSAAAQLAQQIESDVGAVTSEFFNMVGAPGSTSPGTIVDSYADFLLAPQRLDEMAVPTDGRFALFNPRDAYAMIGALASYTGTPKQATDALTRAKLPMLGDMEAYVTNSLPTFTSGTRGGNALIDGANQNSTYASVKDGAWQQTLTIDNVGNAQTVAAGEVFTIADVYAVNPRTKARMSYLQQFTVITGGTSTATATANDQDLSLTISPPIITSGAFQNVSCAGTSSTAPDDNAAITWMGDATEANTDATIYKPNVVMHPRAIALVSAKLTRPFTGESDYTTDPQTGISVRYWRSSDSTNDTHMHRFDVLYGVKAVDRRLGTRLFGT
jgi:hypothetical protein